MDKLRISTFFINFKTSIVGIMVSTFGFLNLIFGTFKLALLSVIVCLIGLFLISVDIRGRNGK